MNKPTPFAIAALAAAILIPRSFTNAQHAGAALFPEHAGDKLAMHLAKLAALDEKMKGIVIPEVNFRDAKIEDVIAFLQKAAHEFDDPTLPIEQRGITFTLNLPKPPGDTHEFDDPTLSIEERGITSAFGAIFEPSYANYPDCLNHINFSCRYATFRTILLTIMDITQMKYDLRDDAIMVMPIGFYDDAMFFTRSYVAPPSFTEKMLAASEKIAIWNARAPENLDETIKEFFIELGVLFPPGSSITRLPDTGELRLTNIPQYFAFFEEVFHELNNEPEANEDDRVRGKTATLFIFRLDNFARATRTYDVSSSILVNAMKTVKTQEFPFSLDQQEAWLPMFFKALGMDSPWGVSFTFKPAVSKLFVEGDHKSLIQLDQIIAEHNLKSTPSPHLRADVIEKMKRIIIPEVNFRDAKIEDVIPFLQDASSEFFDDPGTPVAERGFNFVSNFDIERHDDIVFMFDSDFVRDPFERRDDIVVNFNARNASLHDVFHAVMKRFGMDYYIW